MRTQLGGHSANDGGYRGSGGCISLLHLNALESNCGLTFRSDRTGSQRSMSESLAVISNNVGFLFGPACLSFMLPLCCAPSALQRY